jgi:hypothetical protein
MWSMANIFRKAEVFIKEKSYILLFGNVDGYITAFQLDYNLLEAFL